MSSKSAKKSEQRKSNQQQDGVQASQGEQIQSPKVLLNQSQANKINRRR